MKHETFSAFPRQPSNYFLVHVAQFYFRWQSRGFTSSVLGENLKFYFMRQP